MSAKSSWRVLCVDDDESKRTEVKDIFEKWRGGPVEAISVETEASFQVACERLQAERYDLVTLDLHDENDADPSLSGGESQAGELVLETIRKIRFIPVIFYTAYADKVLHLESPAVKIVRKGTDDVAAVRRSATEIHDTGLPRLIDHIDEEVRKYMWETVSSGWADVQTSVEESDLAYLLARRIASGLSTESVKDLLDHTRNSANAIEHYIYPHLPGSIRTGSILKPSDDGIYWITVTPACDFAQPKKLERVLLVGATLLDKHDAFTKWSSSKWDGVEADPSNGARNAYERLSRVMRNNSGERYRFLPGTFFLPDCVFDFQMTKQVTCEEFDKAEILCRLDEPYRQEFMNAFSRYYGRLGTPDLDMSLAIKRLIASLDNNVSTSESR